MLKFYRIKYTTYHNDEIINSYSKAVILTEKDMTTKTYNFTWENLTELYQEHGLKCAFNIWNFKRGRRVSFFTDHFFKKNHRDIKEWKQPNLNITLVVEYKPFEPPLNYVLNWHDTKAACQYLNEHNLSVK